MSSDLPRVASSQERLQPVASFQCQLSDIPLLLHQFLLCIRDRKRIKQANHLRAASRAQVSRPVSWQMRRLLVWFSFPSGFLMTISISLPNSVTERQKGWKCNRLEEAEVEEEEEEEEEEWQVAGSCRFLWPCLSSSKKMQASSFVPSLICRRRQTENNVPTTKHAYAVWHIVSRDCPDHSIMTIPIFEAYYCLALLQRCTRRF